MAKASPRSVHGVLVLDKPEGPTSHDVVGQCRRIFGTRRIGHAGTLDPMATGVLVMLLGEATKLSSVLTRSRKTYVADIAFGMATDTLDRTGKPTRSKALPPDFLDRVDLTAALERELFREVQVPPLVSAIHVDGKRAHALAREGLDVALRPRPVLVHGLELLERTDARLRLRLTVSKGYYVRAFARDLGETLGVPAHLAELRREASGPFGLSVATAHPPSPEAPLVALETAVRMALPTVELTTEGALRASQGKLLRVEDRVDPDDPSRSALFDVDDPVVAATHQGRLVALLEPDAIAEQFRVRRGFSPAGDD